MKNEYLQTIIGGIVFTLIMVVISVCVNDYQVEKKETKYVDSLKIENLKLDNQLLKLKLVLHKKNAQ